MRLSYDDTSPKTYWPSKEELKGLRTKTLHEIFDIFKTDKGSIDNAHRYAEIYEKIFSHLPHNLIISEIGVACGASLLAFNAYRPDAKIIGYDIRKECENLEATKINNIEILVQDCTEIALKEGSHLIIDDGSHISEDIIKTFSLNWKNLAPGGFYIIEDLACTYSEEYKDNHNNLFERECINSRAEFLRMVDSIMRLIDNSKSNCEYFEYHRELMLIRKRMR